MRRWTVLAVASLAAACAATPIDGPPPIRAGQDLCHGCGMVISDLRYAAAVADDADGEPGVYLFDDLGCLVRWELGHPPGTHRRRWVHDRAAGDWIDAGSARYARDDAWVTPMGSGLAAFHAPGPQGSRGWDEIVAAARFAAEESR